MAKKVSHLVLALALLASATGLPMMPYSPGLMGMFGGGMFGGGGSPHVGQRYSCGSSFGSCKTQKMLNFVAEPTMLAGVQRGTNPVNKMFEGMRAVIEEHNPAGGQTSGQMGPMYGGMGAFRGMGGYGAGALGGYGAGALGGYGAGGLGGYGTGALGMNKLFGGLGHMGGMMGSGFGMQTESASVDLTLTVILGQLVEPIEVLLVFTEASSVDQCTPDTIGSVLTEPSMSATGSQNQAGYGFGFGAPYMTSSAHGGNNMDSYGVIATLPLQSGTNSFKIKGLGHFTSLDQIAGRGIAMCEEVVIGMNGRPMCTGENFAVLFCAQLGYTIEEPTLAEPMMPPQVPASKG